MTSSLRWLCVCFVLITSMVVPDIAFAQMKMQWSNQAAYNNCRADGGIPYCSCMMNYGLKSISPPQVITPLVKCFSSTARADNNSPTRNDPMPPHAPHSTAHPPLGLIPYFSYVFMDSIQNDFSNMTNAMLFFAIVIFGFNMIMGSIDRPVTATVTLVLKIAGITYFISTAPAYYLQLLSVIDAMSGYISEGQKSTLLSGFCQFDPSVATTDRPIVTSMWVQWDCLLDFMLGVGGVALLVGGILAFIVMLVLTNIAAIIVLFFAINLVVTLIFSVLRFIHIYLMALFAFSFIFSLCYLFVPMLIFKNTFSYFRNWLYVLLSYMITPVLTFGLMAMLLVGMDTAFFSGKNPYSIMRSIAAPDDFNPTTGVMLDPTIFASKILTFNNRKASDTDLFYIDNSRGGNIVTNVLKTAVLGPGGTVVDYLLGDKTDHSSCNSRNLDAGGLGPTTSLCRDASGAPIRGSQYQKGSNTGFGSSIVSCPDGQHPRADGSCASANNNHTLFGQSGGFTGLVIDNLIANQNNAVPPPNPPITIQTYIINIILSFASASIFLYVMYSAAGYIPSLIGELAGDSGGIGGTKVAGEAEVKGGLKIAEMVAKGGAG